MLAAADFCYQGIALTSLIFAGLGSYLGSYLKKKGESLAIHENLDKLVEQVAAVTQTTKSIEATISDDVWDRQKRWELKREVLFEATKRLAEIDDTLIDLFSIGQLVKDKKVKDVSAEQSKTYDKWRKASRALGETILLVGIVCGKETLKALGNFRSVANGLIIKLFEDKDLEAYANSKDRYDKSLEEARSAIRKELGIDE
jgi:hypothetical protein